MRNSKNRLKITFAMLAALTLLPSCDSQSTDSELNVAERTVTVGQAKSSLKEARTLLDGGASLQNCIAEMENLDYDWKRLDNKVIPNRCSKIISEEPNTKILDTNCALKVDKLGKLIVIATECLKKNSKL
jgi:hypothetical protein